MNKFHKWLNANTGGGGNSISESRQQQGCRALCCWMHTEWVPNVYMNCLLWQSGWSMNHRNIKWLPCLPQGSISFNVLGWSEKTEQWEERAWLSQPPHVCLQDLSRCCPVWPGGDILYLNTEGILTCRGRKGTGVTIPSSCFSIQFLYDK